jgi:hypothetical protein
MQLLFQAPKSPFKSNPPQIQQLLTLHHSLSKRLLGLLVHGVLVLVNIVVLGPKLAPHNAIAMMTQLTQSPRPVVHLQPNHRPCKGVLLLPMLVKTAQHVMTRMMNVFALMASSVWIVPQFQLLGVKLLPLMTLNVFMAGTSSPGTLVINVVQNVVVATLGATILHLFPPQPLPNQAVLCVV